MSLLILKFEDGGTSEKPKKRYIKRGNQNINLDDYISKLESRYWDWIESRDLDELKKYLITDAYRTVIGALNSGELIPDLGNVSRLVGSSADKIKNAEQGEFDPYGAILSYLNMVLQSMPEELLEEETKGSGKLAWDPNVGISLALNRRLFNGRDSFDDNFLLIDDDYNEETGKRGTAKRWALVDLALNGIENDYDLTDELKASLLNNIQALRDAYSDGQFTDNEQLYLSNLGLDNKWFYTGKNYVPVDDPTAGMSDTDKAIYELEQLAIENEKKLRLADLNKYNEWMAVLENPALSLDLSGGAYTEQDLPQTMSEGFQEKYNAYLLRLHDYTYDILNKVNIYDIDPGVWNANHRTNGIFQGLKDLTWTDTNGLKHHIINPEWTNKQVLAFLLDNYYKLGKQAHSLDVRNDLILMKTSDGMTRIYDPNSRRIYNTPTRLIPNLMGEQPEFASYVAALQQALQLAQQVPTSKNGGIIKALSGFRFNAESNEAIDKRLKAAKKAAEEEKLNAEIEASGKTKELYLAGLRKTSEGFKTEDILRMGAIAGDITATIAAFVPGAGTAVAGAASLTSLGLDFAADYKDDSVSAGEMWTNAAVNLGLGLVSLLPGGGSGKLVKLGKRLLKYIPVGLSLLSSAGIVLDENVHKSLAKLSDPTSMTVDDWKNITKFTSAISSVAGIGGRVAKKAYYSPYKSKVTETGEFNVKTANGNKKITKSQLDEVNTTLKKEGRDAANAKFKQYTGEDLPTNVFLRTGISGKIRGNSELTGTAITENSNQALVRLGRMKYGNWNKNHPILSNILRSDYDVYVNGKAPIRIPFISRFNFDPLSRHNERVAARLSAILARQAATTQARLAARQAAKARRDPADILQRWDLRRNARYNAQVQAAAQAALQARPNISNITGVNAALMAAGVSRTSASGLPILTVTNNQGKNIKFVDLRSKFKLNPNGRNHPISREEKDRLYRILNKSVGADWRSKLANKENLNYLLPNAKAAVVNQRGDTVYWWKQGSKIPKYTGGGGLWSKRYALTPEEAAAGRGAGYHNLIGWGGDHSRRIGTNIEGFVGDPTNLEGVDNVNTLYTGTNNYENRKNDITSALNTYNFTDLSDLQLVDLYNNDINELNNFYDTAQSYNKNAPSETVTNHNRLFKKLFSSRSNGAATSNGLVLGYDSNLEGVHGSTTWYRRGDLYDEDFNGTDANRIFEVTLNGGRKIKVFKKADGTLGLFPTLGNPQEDLQTTGEEDKEGGLLKGTNVPERTADFTKELARLQGLEGLSRGLSLDRLFRTINTNKTLHDLANRQKTYTTITDEHLSKEHGDKASRSTTEQSGVDMRSRAKLNLGSDLSTNLAYLTDIEGKANELNIRGMLADNEEMKRTSLERLKYLMLGIDNRTLNYNQNIERHTNFGNLKLDSKSKYRYMLNKVMQNFIEQEQGEINTKISDARNFYKGLLQSQFAQDLKDDVDAAKQAYRNWTIAHPNATKAQILASPEYLDYIIASKAASINNTNKQFNMYSNLLGFGNSSPIIAKFRV